MINRDDNTKSKALIDITSAASPHSDRVGGGVHLLKLVCDRLNTEREKKAAVIALITSNCCTRVEPRSVHTEPNMSSTQLQFPTQVPQGFKEEGEKSEF